MSSEIWKLERDLCRCCHSEGVFNNLAESCSRTDQKEIYCDMLKDCLDINVDPVPGSLCAITFTICKACIQRLNDAVDFKRQVQACEEKFKNFYNRNAIKVKNGSYNQLGVKVEIPESLSVEKKDGLDIKEEVPETLSDYNEHYTNGDEDDFATFDNEGDNRDTEAVRDSVKKTRGSGKTKMKGRTRNLASKKSSKGDAAEGETDGEELGKKGAKHAAKFRISASDYRRDGDTYQCGHCEKRYDKLSSLRFHLKSKHYKIPRYNCDLCGREFMTLAPFTVHRLEEHGIDERFDCRACKGKFNTKVQLRKHINNFHMLGERYKCESCEYESFSFEGMYKHKFKHRSVKDYHCRFCMKSFLRKTTLDLHERIHTGDRRKVCKVCGQAFVQKASLNYHMTKYHPEVNF